MNTAFWTDPIVQLFVLAVLGLLLSRLVLRGHPVWRLIAHIVFLIALTALLLYHGIQPYAPDTQAGDVITANFHWTRQGGLVDRRSDGVDQFGAPFPHF